VLPTERACCGSSAHFDGNSFHDLLTEVLIRLRQDVRMTHVGGSNDTCPKQDCGWFLVIITTKTCSATIARTLNPTSVPPAAAAAAARRRHTAAYIGALRPETAALRARRRIAAAAAVVAAALHCTTSMRRAEDPAARCCPESGDRRRCHAGCCVTAEPHAAGAPCSSASPVAARSSPAVAQQRV